MDKPLSGKTIIDLSHRLPGPLAGKLLAGLGAKVIKIEDERFKDPFIQGLFAEMDNSFPVWYEKLNAEKQVLRLNFSSTDDQKQIQELVKESDGVIMAIPPKVQAKLGVSREDIEKMNTLTSVIYPLASKEGKQNMHDLNALALTGLLSLHAKGHVKEDMAPPFLPIAGINFGQKMGFDLLACMLKARSTGEPVFMNSYLLESTEEVYAPFWPEELRNDDKFLHNGLYPCYNIYTTKDDYYVVMACVEEKFWTDFCNLFSQSYEAMERFDTSGKIHKELSEYFESKTKDEILKSLDNNDICINII